MGLTNQKFSPHLSFSTYSLTFALASHHLVDGWDKDVIAEDHHMWCKCFFASIWDQLAGDNGKVSGSANVKPMLQLSPVYLPAVSYLVQSDDGWLASIKARFTQARRHSQGLAELCYVLLQYVHLLKSDRLGCLAPSAHVRILSVAGKMVAVHIIASLHSLSVLVATLLVICGVLRWMFSQGIVEALQILAAHGLNRALSLQSLEGVKWALYAIFGAMPFQMILMPAVTYFIVKDTLEGKM